MTPIFFFGLFQLLSVCERWDFDLRWEDEDRKLSARMVLFLVADGRYALVCQKPTTGQLFRFWATSLSNTLFLPGEDLLLTGEASESVQLFSSGPALHRDQWRQFICDGRSKSAEYPTLDGVTLDTRGEWRVIRSESPPFELRLRLRKRNPCHMDLEKLFTITVRESTTIRDWNPLPSRTESTPIENRPHKADPEPGGAAP